MNRMIFWKESDKCMNTTKLLIIVFILNENGNTLRVLQKRVGKELYKIQIGKSLYNSNYNSSLDKV